MNAIEPIGTISGHVLFEGAMHKKWLRAAGAVNAASIATRDSAELPELLRVPEVSSEGAIGHCRPSAGNYHSRAVALLPRPPNSARDDKTVQNCRRVDADGAQDMKTVPGGLSVIVKIAAQRREVGGEIPLVAISLRSGETAVQRDTGPQVECEHLRTSAGRWAVIGSRHPQFVAGMGGSEGRLQVRERVGPARAIVRTICIRVNVDRRGRCVTANCASAQCCDDIPQVRSDPDSLHDMSPPKLRADTQLTLCARSAACPRVWGIHV